MPYKDPEMRRAVHRASDAKRKPERAANSRIYNQHARKLLHRQPFCGVDGEGGNIPTGIVQLDGTVETSHEYLLLRAGEHTLINADGSPLRSRQCLAFLADLPKDRIYVGYYFDYDVTMILRGLRHERIKRIIGPKVNPFASIDIDDKFDVRYLPHKEFAVRRKREGDDGPFTVVSDVGPFFQSSFLHTLEDWDIGTPQERDEIAAGKLQRADFEALSADTDRYNALEIRLLEELMEEYRDVCADAGYIPGKWQGPGWLATSMLRKHDVPRRKDLPVTNNKLLMDLANDAYYGGRFETTAVGPVNQTVYEYDICSAYPNAMTKLPCLACGTWTRHRTRPEGKKLGFGMVTFTHPRAQFLCNLPIRTKEGGLTFPKNGSGVYWSVEVDAAVSCGTEVDYGVWYTYSRGKTCMCQPFGFIPEVYAERKRLGKSAKGKVLKLALNSLYGKMAQSIGRPAYANAVYASLITALTRAKLIYGYRQAPNDILMIATDALYSRVPLRLDLGPGLGQWEEEVHPEGVFIVMPGVYFAGGDARNKTRGIPATRFAPLRPEFERVFESMKGPDPLPAVRVPTTQFISLKLAASWNRLQDAGQWEEGDRKVSFDWSAKRVPHRLVWSADGISRTLPQEQAENLVSIPYKRLIGGAPRQDDQAREQATSQPDWSRWFHPG